MKKIYQNTEKKEYVKPNVEVRSESYFCMKPSANTSTMTGSAKDSGTSLFSDEMDVDNEF